MKKKEPRKIKYNQDKCWSCSAIGYPEKERRVTTLQIKSPASGRVTWIALCQSCVLFQLEKLKIIKELEENNK